MRKIVRRLSTAVALALILVLLTSTFVFAIANPDSIAIGNVELYDDVFETGDLGIFLDFIITYSSPPTETITEAYLVAFNDTDGTTHLKSIVPYTFINDGYNYTHLAWIYFTAAEVTADSISSANMASHRVEVYGNSGLGWVPGPAPSQIDTLDTWNTTGDPNVLLALDILDYADTLETEWSLDLVQTTSVGSKLTTYGNTYFENVIDSARTAAPGAFYTSLTTPTDEDINYETEFGGTLTNGTGTATGSPITLVEGANTVAVTATGTFTIELERGTEGTAASVGGGGTVTGSPVTLREGTNTITTTSTGNITVTVALVNTQTTITDTVSGTVMDLSTVAARFGLTNAWMTGGVWFILGIVVCGAAYRRAGSKIVIIIFDLWIIAGALLGMVPVLAAVLLFIGFVALSAYVLFFRTANV